MFEEYINKPQYLPGFEIEEKDTDEFLSVEEQWQYFQDTVDLRGVPDITDEQLKEIILNNLNFISSMDVKEYTLYQKWLEIQTKYPTVPMYSFIDNKPALKNPKQASFINTVKSNLWTANNIDDYLDIEPELILATDKNNLLKIWSELRIFVHTQRFNSNIGRNLFFIISDKKTKKYLGVVCLSSDFLDLATRDNYIGWERKRKTEKMIKNTTIGSTILSVQPFGYNYVGGKLLALLCLSDPVQKVWQEQYGETLVGVTTTSLYGKTKVVPLSQYDRLKYWKKMSFTKGSVSYETSRSTRTKIEQWLMKNHTYKYFEWYFAKMKTGPLKRDHRNRSFTFTYKRLGIPDSAFKSEHSRGVYFAELYNNTREFLREEIPQDKLIKKMDTSVESLTDLWKTKYAKKRIDSLVNQQRVSSEPLFYDDVIYMTWEETREKYLPSVGR